MLNVIPKAVMAVSQQIKDASIAIDPNSANADYIAAMLRLSADIGTMANRIGEMADRIVVTEGLIGEMADRIVVVAGEILTTNTTTQSNLLAAQTNFSTALARSR
jgi:predicted RNA-binding protein with EMAP domain